VTSTPPPTPPDPSELAELAVRLAEAAGASLLDRLVGPHVAVATKTSATDMVSDADRAAEALVVDGIRAARPADAVLGEEGAAHDGTSGVRWVVDPLDGTTNFLYRLPAFAVSIGVEVDGRPLVGVVVDPVHGETYTAVAGRGAACNGRRLHVDDRTDLAAALVGTGFSYESARRRRQAGVLAEVLPAVRDIRRVGAAALDLCWVAAGRLDAFYEKGLAPWDHAAGALIASEAGARTTDLHGGPPSGDFVLAAAPGIHEPLRRLLLEADAGRA
jgi:myo-inositol-1(or 4)-monophosphatase